MSTQLAVPTLEGTFIPKPKLEPILTEREILLKNKIQKWQLEAVLSQAQVRVLAASRQTGKSFLLRLICYNEMLSNPGCNILYLAPTIKQVRQIGFRQMFLKRDSLFTKDQIFDMNKTELAVELNNGSRIVFAGTEAVDKLRGFSGFTLLVLDEYSVMDPDVLTTLEPIISAYNGRIVIAATPLGRNHFYEIVENGILDSPTKKPGYRSWVLPITHPDVVVPNKQLRIQKAKNTLSKQAFEQEYLVSFSSASGLVYKSFDMTESMSSLTINKDLGLFLGIDFNVSKMVVVVGQRVKNKDNIEELHILDEIVQYDTNTQAMTNEIVRRYNGLFNGRITIYPDASGSARKTSSNKTDHTILSNAGLRVMSPKANPDILDRVNAVDALFQTASGLRRLFIHPSCKETIKSVSSQVIDPKTGKPEKGSGANDISAAPDALGYMVNMLYPITSNVEVVQYGFR